MTDNIVERLRRSHAANDGMFPELGEAADEIERLRTEILSLELLVEELQLEEHE